MNNNADITTRIEALREKIEPPFSAPYFLVPVEIQPGPDLDEYLQLHYLVGAIKHRLPYTWLVGKMAGIGFDMDADMPTGWAEQRYNELMNKTHIPSFL